MVIKIRKAGAATILDLNGALMVGESEGKFRQQVKELLADGERQIAINLAGLTDMDSWGLGSLVRHCAEVRRNGGRCVFFAPTPRVLQLIKIANLDSVLDIAADEAAALSHV
ncbi:MAG TPA: STAS domain-containing protein [Candidatus Acidoferrales bacterium]|nr:STAS domain-containing protein [Candidatus Acidoferrales bacterium]